MKEQNHQRQTIDGMTAAALAAYQCSDVAMIYPITPASRMAETIARWSAQTKTNAFGRPVSVHEMQSEKGVSGAFHGALSGGALATSFTASQGLLLMIPNLYKIAAEQWPGVIHVTTRSIATHALSIFGDHQDVMAVRATGWAMLASGSVQECHDLALVAHLTALQSSLPFIHFFDGFRTSDEIQTIETLPDEVIDGLVPQDQVAAFRARSLNPENPHQAGTAQNPDVYFQQREAANPLYDALPSIVQKTMDSIASLTGRAYHLFDYVGAPDANRVIVTLASSGETVEAVVNHLVARGEKVGLIKVRLYRPFSVEHLREALPSSVQVLCALDRTKEPGSAGEPLYLDLCAAVNEWEQAGQETPQVMGCRYGLSSKEFTPAMVAAIFEAMKDPSAHRHSTVGVKDDLTHLSLPVGEPLRLLDHQVYQAIFYGFGSDGTVSASKGAASIIANATDNYVQNYSWFDSKKSGGLTISYLRCAPNPIHAPYIVDECDYLACHKDIYVHRGYPILDPLKEGGVFVLNCAWSRDELETQLPAEFKRVIAQKHLRFYTVDAAAVAASVGLGHRVNMIMEVAFFSLSGVMDADRAVAALKDEITSLYGSQGQAVVEANRQAIDQARSSLVAVNYPASWAEAANGAVVDDYLARLHEQRPKNAGVADGREKQTLSLTNDFVRDVFTPLSRLEGNSLPTSALAGVHGSGFMPLGTAALEKRTVAFEVPQWDVNKCIQCFQCATVCPHAAIRPYLATDDELDGAPETFATKTPVLTPLKDLHFRIQVYPEDCVGCGSCADNCPAPGKALVMKPLPTQLETERQNLAFAQRSITIKDDRMPATTVAGVQLRQPLLEFSGACAGCGETPHVKLLTQLFGDRLIIANATGCSSIWGAYMPSMPYQINSRGRGPAWANSLFEDNGEFGLGIAVALKERRERLANGVRRLSRDKSIDEALRQACSAWLAEKDEGEESLARSETLRQSLAAYLVSHDAVMTAQDSSSSTTDSQSQPANESSAPMTSAQTAHATQTIETVQLLRALSQNASLLAKPSVWAVGGDGWAYDIDFDGLDAALASGEDLNILVLDTEGYSNTGGEASKATPLGSVTGFTYEGKDTPKKKLGAMLMAYDYVYVAQICLGASMQQAIDALREAERHPGPSIVIALCPCISWGIKGGMATNIAECKKAVASGYWNLFRYNPVLRDLGKNPLTVDSSAPDGSLAQLLSHENRYQTLAAREPVRAHRLGSEMAKQLDSDYHDLTHRFS